MRDEQPPQSSLITLGMKIIGEESRSDYHSLKDMKSFLTLFVSQFKDVEPEIYAALERLEKEFGMTDKFEKCPTRDITTEINEFLEEKRIYLTEPLQSLRDRKGESRKITIVIEMTADQVNEILKKHLRVLKLETKKVIESKCIKEIEARMGRGKTLEKLFAEGKG